MSGHSHFKTVKRIKEAHDKQRAKIFSKLARAISVAVREGSDPKTNPKLRQILEEAKKLDLPKSNIQRAIDRGTGKIAGEKLESITFEAYGPGGIAIIIEGITDNKNRALGDIKRILSQNKGKLASEGSVKWLFERKGVISIKRENKRENKEEIELKAIDAGAEDIYLSDEFIEVYTKPEKLDKVKNNLKEKGIEIESASLDWVAKEEIEIEKKDKEACQKLFEQLDENDSVQDIYSNLRNF